MPRDTERAAPVRKVGDQSTMILLITGASGSGTTTLGRALADEYAFTHLDTDDYYWFPTDPPFRQKRAPDERRDMLLTDLQSASCNAVISGSLMNWGEDLENALDLIVYLHLKTCIRIARLIEREMLRYGSVDPAFIEWASLYESGTAEGRSRAKHAEWLSRRACPVITLEGDLSVPERISRISGSLAGVPRRSSN